MGMHGMCMQLEYGIFAPKKNYPFINNTMHMHIPMLIGMLSKRKGQTLHVAAVMHVLFQI